MEKGSVSDKMDEFFEYTAKFMEKYPEIASSFTTLMGSVIQDGKLASKEKELIAVGIAVGLRCVPSIRTLDAVRLPGCSRPPGSDAFVR